MKRNPDLECLITPLPPPVRLVSLYKGSFGLILQKIGYISLYLLTNDIHKWIILIFIHLAKKDKRKEICYTNINNECIFLAVQCQFENCFICICLICQKSISETYGLSPPISESSLFPHVSWRSFHHGLSIPVYISLAPVKGPPSPSLYGPATT